MLAKHETLIRRPFISGLALLALFTLVCTTVSAQEAPSALELTNSHKSKLHSGEVIVELEQGDINRGEVTGIIQAPMADVIPLVERCWEYGDWRESVTDTSLEERVSEEVVVCGGTAIVPFPARNRHGHFRVHNHTRDVDGVQSFVSVFKYIDGSGNMEDMFGYWMLQPYGKNGEHTILRHVLHVDIGSWIPGALIRWATRRSLPDTILGIRKHISDAKNQGLSSPDFWRGHSYD